MEQENEQRRRLEAASKAAALNQQKQQQQQQESQQVVRNNKINARKQQVSLWLSCLAFQEVKLAFWWLGSLLWGLTVLIK